MRSEPQSANASGQARTGRGTRVGFVFISHANEDKQRIAPYLRLLRAAQLPLWIDRAHELGPEFDREGRIQLGDAWPSSIARALEESGCILVFWSLNSIKPHRAELHREANTGLRHGKLVQVQLDREAMAQLHPVFTEVQGETVVSLENEEEISRSVARVAEAIRRQIDLSRRRRLEASQRVPACLLPYAIDRHPQIDRMCADVAHSLRRMESSPQLAPRALYIAVARSSDCPDRLPERLSRLDGPETCRRLQRQDWQDWDDEIALRWPNEATSPPDRLGERIEAILERHAGRLDRPRCVVSYIDRVRREEGAFVGAWHRGWVKHFQAVPRSPLIPLLFVRRDRKGLVANFRLRRLLTSIKAMQQAAGDNGLAAVPVLLDDFSEISADDARMWARQNFAEARVRIDVDDFVRKTFGKESVQLTMAAFAHQVTLTDWYRKVLHG